MPDEITKESVYTSTGQEISPLDPNYDIYAGQNNPAPVVSVPGLPDPTAPAENIVGGTQDDEDANTIAAQDVETGITAAEDGVETPAAALARLQNEQEQSKILNKSELDAIDAAGEEARLAYETLVEEQRENRRITMPKEVIRAGEKGGFLSTQQAGIAAMSPTGKVAGEAFLGTTAPSAEFPDGQRGGGALDQKRQTLDRAIVLAQSKQQQAILAAKRAQRTAIMTRKRSDYDMSLNLAKLAQQFANDAEQLKMEKKRLAVSVAADKRQGISAKYAIMKDLKSGETIEIDGETFTGIQSTEPFFNQERLFNIMGKLEEGETVTVVDPVTNEEITINGFMPVDEESNTQTFVDDRGYAHVLDLDTGKEISRSEAPVGKSKTFPTSIIINSDTGLNANQTTQARANYLKNNAGKTIEDFEALNASEKLTWYGGGPELSDADQELTDVINEQKDYLASENGYWEVAYKTLIGRDSSLNDKLSEADKKEIQEQTGIYYGPEYETMADILLNKKDYYNK